MADAFLKVFPKGQAPNKLDPIPRLILRSRDDIVGPGITTIPQAVGRQAEVDLYANAHCYVSGSLGEGWGFMPFQAIAQGCPTILGDAHGHHEFAHYGIPIETHPFRCEKATFWGDGGYWWEPDFDQMCEAMWDAYNNYDEYVDAARYGSLAVHAEFSWEESAKALILALGDELFKDGPTEKVWKGATPRLFRIRVNKSCTYTINGVAYHFEPGQDYYEAADLKRAILAAGHLDLSTFTEEDLGMEDDVDIVELRGRNSLCPTCHQRYNQDDSSQNGWPVSRGAS